MKRINLRAVTLKASLEAVSEQTQIEDEQVFYGRLSEEGFAELQRLAHDRDGSIEVQEQYSILKPNAGTIRVRKVVDETDEVKYIMTAKRFLEGTSKKPEKEEYVSAAMFEMFTYICDSGMHKTRYTITTPDGDWEYDIFYDTAGNRHEWCKVDLEDSTATPDKMPVQLTDLIIDKPHARTPEEKEFIGQLYEKYFKVPPRT